MCVGGGGTLIFSYIRRLGSFFGLKILNFNISNILWGFQKNKYVWGYEDFVDIFWGGHHEIGLYLGDSSMHLMGFLKVKVQNGGIFLGC